MHRCEVVFFRINCTLWKHGRRGAWPQGRVPAHFLPEVIHLAQRLLGCLVAGGLQSLVHLVQCQRCACILNGVVRLSLDVDTQQEGGQETQAELSLALEAEQLGGVHHLGGRHHDVDHAEVLLQPVPHQQAAGVHQMSQLQVGALACGQVLAALRQVQVPRNNAREAGEIVGDGLVEVDVVVHAGLPRHGPLPAHDGHPRQAQPRHPRLHVATALQDLVGVGKCHKLSIDPEHHPRLRQLVVPEHRERRPV
mmetsp:Transcript_6704/g.19281  ORF Transcript_6704/g.19281 Transcript_6704/m.19281 type:complete len:251 (-) Transcript_6704:3212-3964(-)